MKKTILIFAFSIFHLTMFAQIPVIIDYLKYTDTEDRNEKYNKYEGSIYLNNDFVFGSVLDIDNGTSKSAYLRYNILEDLVEIKLTPDSDIRILPKMENIKYDFGNYSLVINEAVSEESYYLEYYDKANLKFLAKPTLAATRIGSEIPESDNILIYPDFKYFILKDDIMKEIDLKNKDLRRVFAGNTQAENYLRLNRVNNVEKIKHFLESSQN